MSSDVLVENRHLKFSRSNLLETENGKRTWKIISDRAAAFGGRSTQTRDAVLHAGGGEEQPYGARVVRRA